MVKKIILLLLVQSCVGLLFAQETSGKEENNADQVMPQRVILANSVKDYPVTPGDVYTLGYITSGGGRSLDVTVQSDFSLNLGVFGSVTARDLTYRELRDKIEDLVRRSYPGSRPRFIISSTGIFQVYLKGEVQKAQYVTCWGLSRLSEVITGKTTPYSSFRDVDVVSEEGVARTFDLFKAERFGDIEQDPYVKPGSTVVVKEYKRQVKVYGEVARPGTYQLLRGEGLNELLTRFAGGFTALSDASRIRVLRIVAADNKDDKDGLAFYLDAGSSRFREFEPGNLDEVYVPSKKDSLPVVYFEGALDAEQKQGGNKEPGSQKITYRFVEGQMVSSALQELYPRFSAESDLKNAYIVRAGEDKPLPVDIEALIHNYKPENDIELMPYDRVVIPFRQYYVTVSGAVLKPGLYPYMPGRSYKYYVQLAGGTDPQKNVGGHVSITDVNDVVQAPTRIIQPEDKIYADYNNALYHANQWAVLIGTAVSVTALVLTIIQLSH
jgi:polysaccharide export outer membrane protein